MNFGDTLWLIVSSFFFVAYLVILYHVVVDVFRDKELSGFSKAVWLVGLVFVPMLTALLYVILHGQDMAQRQRVADARVQSETDAYLRQAAGRSSPADQITSAKHLLDAGAISQDEFVRLKAAALA